jgi:hypothetical protein
MTPAGAADRIILGARVRLGGIALLRGDRSPSEDKLALTSLSRKRAVRRGVDAPVRCARIRVEVPDLRRGRRGLRRVASEGPRDFPRGLDRAQAGVSPRSASRAPVAPFRRPESRATRCPQRHPRTEGRAMRLKASVHLGVCLLGVTVGPVLFGSGCGGSSESGTVAKPGKEQAQRYRQMEGFMKSEKPAPSPRKGKRSISTTEGRLPGGREAAQVVLCSRRRDSRVEG